jgi:hypothetical protein
MKYWRRSWAKDFKLAWAEPYPFKSKNVAAYYLLCHLNGMKWESLLTLVANEPVFTSALLLAGVEVRQWGA